MRRLQSLTPDERYIRSYYLDFAPGRFTQVASEAQLLAPAVIFAAFAHYSGDVGFLWLSCMYSLGLYLWRLAGTRWAKATASLVAKYEQALEAPEPEAVATQ